MLLGMLESILESLGSSPRPAAHSSLLLVQILRGSRLKYLVLATQMETMVEWRLLEWIWSSSGCCRPVESELQDKRFPI